MIITCKISPGVNTISHCKISFARKMLPISQKGKNITILFTDYNNVLLYENCFFIRGQLLCVEIRKYRWWKTLQANHTHLSICPLLILNHELCGEGGPRPQFKGDEVCLISSLAFLFFVFLFVYSATAVAR